MLLDPDILADVAEDHDTRPFQIQTGIYAAVSGAGEYKSSFHVKIILERPWLSWQLLLDLSESLMA